MLSEADTAVVARDPAIPGLGLLLDDTALTAAIAAQVPSLELDRAHVDYLRYKRGTNCVARLQLHSSSKQLMGYAIAYAKDAQDKIVKSIHHRGGPPLLLLANSTIALYCFPHDRELPLLSHIASSLELQRLVRRVIPEHAILDNLSTVTLRYKPERRYVATLLTDGRPFAALKIYSTDNYRTARRATKSIDGMCESHWPQCIGHSDRHAVMLFEWINGTSLSTLQLASSTTIDAFRSAARVLCAFHGQRAAKLPTEAPATITQRLLSQLVDLARLSDELADVASRLWQAIHRDWNLTKQTKLVPIHGDFHLDQIQIGREAVNLLDFDRARMGDPAEDLGALYADLVRRQTADCLNGATIEPVFDAFLAEYTAAGGVADLRQVNMYAGIRLLHSAVEPFRYRHSEWPKESRRLLDIAKDLLDFPHFPLRQTAKSTPANTGRTRTQIVRVNDPFNLSYDTLLLGSGEAIKPDVVAERLWNMPSMNGEHAGIEMTSIAVVRHKFGRRCLIEYQGWSRSSGLPIAILGKIDAKRRHSRHFEQQVKLWNSGFDAQSPDGACVARPWGLVSEWNMWLQEKIGSGDTWMGLQKPDGARIARQIAFALAKLHKANLPLDRTHTLSDEMAILADRLVSAAHELPEFSSRILRLLENCKRVADQCDPNCACAIHRDFYPDQVLITDQQLTLLDFDLLCEGDPAVDVGNFRGHLIEKSLRCWQHPNRYAAAEAAFLEEYLQQCPHVSTLTINNYTLFTLARHVYLCGKHQERRHNVPLVLSACEQLVHTHLSGRNTLPNSHSFVASSTYRA